MGWYAAEQFRERYGRDQVEREREIDWGLGTGHADVYVKSEKLIVEVVSSTSPAGIFAAKVRQARQYLHFDPEAEKAAVYVIDPSDLDREDLIPIVLSQADRDEIDRDVQAVKAALDGGPLPECCASSPTECRRSYLCSFTDAAWEGWEPPAAVDLSEDTEAVGAAEKLYAVRVRRQRRKADDDADDQEQRELQARLADIGLVPGLDYLLGGVKLKRTVCQGRETFSYSMAKKAGLVDGELLAPFVKVGQPYERWSVTRTEASRGTLGLGDEFGEDAPF